MSEIKEKISNLYQNKIIKGAVIIIALIFWPFALGSFLIVKIRKSRWDETVKSLTILFLIITTLFLGVPWVQAVFSPSKEKASVSDKKQKEIKPTPLPSPISSPSPSPSPQIKKSQVLSETTEKPTEENLVKVIEVIDGDTIKIEGGKKVRYIGIDTPETKHPSVPLQCFGKEASNKNKELVLGKKVRLEKDVSETDKYGRLLRYIWIDSILVNEYLAREGYAKSSSYPPDIKYQERIITAQRKAIAENKGLWSACNEEEQNIAVSPKPKTQQPSTNTGNYTCNCSKTCSQMVDCAEAYFQLNNCGCSKRDGDDDGIPCESICL